MVRRVEALVSILAYGLLALVLRADDNSHIYQRGDEVTLWVNTVGPYHNPQETYAYYSLPYCKPEHGINTHKRAAGMGEILEGHELRNSGLKLHFPVNVDKEDVCDLVLEKEHVMEFEGAVDQQYWYELFLDDLPMWGMVGEILRDDAHGRMEKHIFTHRSVSISYNGDRIIEVNLTSENPVPIEVGRELAFTYSVHWMETSKPFENRFGRYLEYDFFEHKIHFFSVFNSIMMVIFLCGLVALILLRTLRNDFARYAKKGDEEMDLEGIEALGEDSGWKQVHGDVFRAPLYLTLFAACYGTGWQLLVLVLAVVLYAMAGPLLHGNMYEDRGEMMSTFIVCFALSSAVGGYASGSFYRQFFSGRTEAHSEWQRAMVVTALLFPVVIAVITLFLNAIAVSYESISAVPISVMMKMTGIWLFVALPLSVIGTIFGRHWVGKVDPPCRVNSIPRPIPTPSWYADPKFIIPVTGLLPFGSIFIEMYFMFTAFWSYKFYYVYGFMLLTYGILGMVTVCTTIVVVYFILNAENYHWQWIAFLSAGSTALYVFLYSVFYFFYKTQMTGLLQVSFYFGYTYVHTSYYALLYITNKHSYFQIYMYNHVCYECKHWVAIISPIFSLTEPYFDTYICFIYVGFYSAWLCS
jgi:transmembrane 9 superfamily protein 3